eukprot:242437-Prymnesium_polylepis.1
MRNCAGVKYPGTSHHIVPVRCLRAVNTVESSRTMRADPAGVMSRVRSVDLRMRKKTHRDMEESGEKSCYCPHVRTYLLDLSTTRTSCQRHSRAA